jgi:RNA polymerase sigma factor (sigma-70 family)
MTRDQERRLVDVVDREQSRLRSFIRRRVADPRDVEDILQDVFSELVEANQLLMPIEHLTGWLFRVARNRIIDLFRKKKPDVFDDDSEALLPSVGEGPDAAYARSVLLDELEHAIGELPAEQREVFIAHEINGESFKEISARTGVNVNTLLSRKRYAVIQLRKRLQSVYDDLTNR